MLVPVTAACIAAAASAFGVSEPSLWLILKTEAGQVGQCTVQKNKSHDCGPAQINAETWVKPFADMLHRPVPQIFYEIRDNGCFNIEAAALILRQKIDEGGGDKWDGMGRYNSATPSLKAAYQDRLIEAYRQLFETPPRTARHANP